jgi:hypothetical protein
LAEPDRDAARAGVRAVAVALLMSALAAGAHAAPPSRAELTALCVEAEDQAQCGRLVEARLLRKLSRIVERDGDELRVSLVPFGLAVFRDSAYARGSRSYAIFDYLEDLDTLVLFTTQGERSGFLLVQRRGGGEFAIPSEPVFSADRKRFATADVCADGCENEIAVWRVEPDGIRKEAWWKPPAEWSDASVTWRTGGVLAIEYATAADAGSQTVERRLADPSWRRPTK